MLYALADRVDFGVARRHVVADQDAAVDVELGGARQVDIGADADRQHDQIGRDLAPVGEDDAFGFVGSEDFLGLAVGKKGDAARIEIALQQLARRCIELALHQARHQMHDRDRHAPALQPPGRFEAEEAAADHDGAPLGRGRVDHRLDIGYVAEGAHPGQAQPRNRRRQGLGAGGEQQLVVWHRLPTGDRHRFRGAVDRVNRLPGDQPDAVLVVPVRRIDDDLVDRLFAGQHRGQQDAVVVRVRLGADDGDGVAVGSAGQQLLDRAHSGHPVADDNEALAARPNIAHRRLRRALRPGLAPAGQESSCACNTTRSARCS